MTFSKAKQFYKNTENQGLTSTDNLRIFKKINFELLKSVNLISQKIQKKETDSIRQKNFTKCLMIIYTIQTNLDFEANEKISSDFFNFYEFCRKKIISSVSFRKYKDLDKVAVNIDTLFNFNFFANLET